MHKDSIIEFIEDVFRQEFKNAIVGGWFQVNGRTVSGDLNNAFHLGTRYYAQSFDKRYLHFTGSKSAIEILKSGCLWLSNLNMFNDKLEFSLATSKLLKISDESHREFKRRIFATCFTELTDDQNVYSDYPYHWHRYSNECNGVSLEFELGPCNKRLGVEDPVLYPFYYLLKVQYHNKLEEDELFVRLKERLSAKHSEGLDEDSLTEFLLPLLSAHKLEETASDNFSSEEEIRLFYSDSTDPADRDIYIGDNKEEATFAGTESTTDRPFRQLPFNTDSTFLRLKAIHLGSNLTERDRVCIAELASESGIQVNAKAG